MTATLVPKCAVLRDESGRALHAPADRWFAAVEPADERALADVRGPVIDIGCGPGRHVLALTERGIPTLGIDITDRALFHARARNVPVLSRCVFDPLPGVGRWRSALLLDGNLGIGGNPLLLLQRVREILAPGGEVLVEINPPGQAVERRRVRFEIDDTIGPWFDWASVDHDGLPAVAVAAGLTIRRAWCDEARWFAWLGR
ncbi:MAG: SAM-dependent methyltransferase [Acidimicrobiia bacterium]